MKVHAEELSALGGTLLGLEFGALSVDHLLHYQKLGPLHKTLESFRRAGTIPVFLPGTAFFLKLPYADPVPFLESGIPVAIATDFNPGSCMSQNILQMTTLGVLYMGMTVEETLAAITVNAARALGLKNCGFLDQGARADFQVFDVAYSQLSYEFGRPILRNLFLGGELFFRS